MIGIERGRSDAVGRRSVMPNAGMASATMAIGADGQGGGRVAQGGPEQGRPDARLARTGCGQAPQERDARPVHPTTELGQQRRQHGQRAEHGDQHDQDRADGERGERRVAGDEHAAHRDDDGDAGDHDGVTGGGSGNLDGLEPVGALGPFLPLAADVEQRVVDADRHADEQDDAGDRVARRDDVRGEGGESDGRCDRGQCQQQRHSGSDEGAERDEQDDQGERQADQLGLVQVTADGGAERLVERGVADLLDPQRRGARRRPWR